MNSSILRSVWRLRNLTFLRKLSPGVGRGYATQIDQKPYFPIHQIRRSCATNHAVKEKTTNLEQVLNKVQSDFTQFGTVHSGNFVKLLESVENGATLTTEQNLFLLEACCADFMPSQSPETRMKLFEKLWEHLKTNEQLKKQHYFTYLKIYSSNGVYFGDLRTFLKESGLTQDPEIYEELIKYACELGDMKMATEILSEIREKSFSITEDIFNALAMGHAKNKNLEGVMNVLEAMNAAGVQLTVSTHVQVIDAYIANNELAKATELLQQYSGQLNPNQIVRLLKTLTSVEQNETNRKLMELLIKELPADLLTEKEVPSLIRNFCTELIHTGRVNEANAIMEVLPSPKFNENQDIDTFGYIFLQDLFRGKVQSNRIIEIAKGLKDSGKNSRALHIVCDIAMHRNPDMVLPFMKALSEIEPLRPHYFWPLLLHKFIRNGEAGILNVMKMMSDLGVACDSETLTLYVLPRLSVSLDNAHQAIKTLENCGLKTSQTLTPIIVQLIFQQKLEEVVKIAMLYTSKFDTNQFVKPLANLAANIRATKRYKIYTNAIHTLQVKTDDPKSDFVGKVMLEIIGYNKLQNDFAVLSRIVTDLSRLGTKISSAAAEALNAHVERIKNINKDDTDIFRRTLATMVDRKLALNLGDNTSSRIAHPRDMSYEELECHLVELEAKGMNTRGVLRRLLQICVRDGRLERAVEVKKKCEFAKVQLSPGMLASIFDMYIKLGDYSAAEESYYQLQKTFPGFLLDEHKLIDFAALTVRQNNLEKAKQLLSDRAASKKVYGGDYVIKNVWNLLTSVAQLAAQQTDLPKEKNLTKEVFYFIKKLGYCNSHNAVLGPIVREYMYRKDIRSAIAEFKTLAETFRHTPLQFELSSLLVRLSNEEDPESFDITKEEAKDLLQQLTTTVSSIHGVVNMNSSLLLAVAESGTENQLRKLLMNPEFRVNDEMLKQNCDHLNKEGSIQTLMRLAKACRGLGHVIKEHDLYDMLLLKFVEDNNCSAALELFDKLEADDEMKMSQEFLKSLVNLLKVNKVEIPSSLALRAQVI